MSFGEAAQVVVVIALGVALGRMIGDIIEWFVRNR